MRSLPGVLARLLVVALVVAVGVAAVGVLVAALRDGSVRETVAYAYWI